MRKKTHEEYIEEVAKLNIDIEVIGIYINTYTPILHRCKIDGYEWYAKPNNILNGKGCPKCYGNIKKTHQEYVEEVTLINPNIEVVGEYINNHTKILHRCKIDGHQWMSPPNNILNGKGCPKCYGNAKMTHKEYVEKLLIINPNIEVIGKYVNVATKTLHRCKIDGYEWLPRPHDILAGCGCPKCKTSKGEKAIEEWIKKQNILYEVQKRFHDCRDKNPLPFDFYLPDHNICIEYQGGQHYFEVEYFGGKEKFEIQKKHDKIKKEYCEQNNIKLFEIPYFSNLNEELEKLHMLIIEQDRLIKEVAV